ncbi:cell division protein FtsQ/DivIB [Pseudarthrobacter enclensis]|uniref:cell division protein FtsQ/DivIB n=1 Tax=Pseudarthrobacter enclensis TaxID=993070 RepID=UPI001E74D161|nr:hypothetical protein NtRootA9_16010 [Arthrobacter sp. NtRootA9]
MASTRRPTYTPVRGKETSGAGSRPGTQEDGGTDDVISASRNVPAATGKPASSGRIPPGKASPGKDAPAPGANVLAFPEPKGRRRRRRVLAAVATVCVLVAALLAAAIYSPVLALQTVSVSGTSLLAPAQVQAALEPLKGKPLPQITDDEVRRLLEPLVQVKSVSAEARPPSELAVIVRERIPVALVKQGEQYQLVDVDGVQLATTADPAAVSLPLIDGGAGAIGQDLFKATAAVLGALPADVLAKLSNASAKSVDAVELKLVDGQTIVWGNASEKELKAKVLAALLKVPADPKNPVQVYDVSVPRHPVTR